MSSEEDDDDDDEKVVNDLTGSVLENLATALVACNSSSEESRDLRGLPDTQNRDDGTSTNPQTLK